MNCIPRKEASLAFFLKILMNSVKDKTKISKQGLNFMFLVKHL